VPYKGSNPGLTALAGGQVQFMFVAVLAATPLIEQQKVRALAVTTAQRNPVLPNLPAVREVPGLEQFESDLWYGLLAPGRTNPAVVDKLYNQTKIILSRPDVKSRFEPSGTILVGNSPKQFAEVIRKDIAKWGNVIKAAKVTADYGG
jgi:tripartite-type tricarboxylate transporter receptor subunit TctC